MEFRRSGQRDDRRRRVLRDDAIVGDRDGSAETASTDEAESATETLARDYSSSARRIAQPRAVDFLPKRAWWLTAIVVLLLLVVSGFGWAEHRFSETTHDETAEATAVDLELHRLLRPSIPGGLDAWFASSLFLAATLTSLQILAMRRFKSNDYRGTYQIWGWVAALMLLASIDCTAHVSALADAFAASRWNLALPFEHVKWSHWLIAAIGALFLARIGLETRRSTAAWVSLVVAALCYVSGMFGPSVVESIANIQAPVANEITESTETVTLISENSTSGTKTAELDSPEAASVASSFWTPFPTHTFWLAGHIFILVSLLGYARYVYLEAHGIVRQRTTTQQSTGRLAGIRKRRAQTRARKKADKEERRRKLAAEREAERKAEELEELAQQEAAEAKKKERQEAKERQAAERAEAKERLAAERAEAKKGKREAKRSRRKVEADPQVDEPVETPNKKREETATNLRVVHDQDADSHGSPPPRKKGKQANRKAAASHGARAESMPTSDEELLEELGMGMGGRDHGSSKGGQSKAERRRQRKNKKGSQRRAA